MVVPPTVLATRFAVAVIDDSHRAAVHVGQMVERVKLIKVPG